MADSKLTALSELTAVELTDLLYVVDDPGGSAASKKATVRSVVPSLAFPFSRAATPSGTTFYGLPGYSPIGQRQTALGQYEVYAVPFFVPRPITVTGIDTYVAAGNEADKVIRFGLYASGDANKAWNPGALTLDCGTLSVATAGAKAITGLSQSLTPGVHFLAFSTNASGLQLYGWTVTTPAPYMFMGGGTAAAYGVVMWWYDYDSDPDIPVAGMPNPLAGNVDQFGQATNAAPAIYATLRWTL